MSTLTSRNFDSPDETRTPDKTRIDVVDLGGPKAARLTAQPGWRWSECIKPVVGGDSCQTRHLGVVVSGRIHVAHEDGTEAEVGSGDAYAIEPGHDAWVVGDEPFVAYEFDTTAASTYARPS
ncbi:cupin domain-containing protein [Antrihabitans stalactiti]|uniref:Cupin domain-containing protein n=1 Tax=Antrihabitans stalactiti TaxID=2584121 RepID=A0A848KHW2_9NOCA|nr:cupin domain-containing protein [Antrihabitans stalactiti]NMN98325.1 cupin domain-containing protein [Antrihabitans stalactiti]